MNETINVWSSEQRGLSPLYASEEVQYVPKPKQNYFYGSGQNNKIQVS